MARMTFMTKSKDSNILLRNSRDPRKHLGSYWKTKQAENSKPTSQLQIEQFHFYLLDRLSFYLRFLRREGSVVYQKA